MKGLRLFLPPFAPDTAGASSVLYPLGALVVIVDAGGCSGNICGFDEPRFRETNKTTSVFTSAALRDMDAILGRDKKLIEHIASPIQEFQSAGRSFPLIALVGTPVPAVIGTDLSAIARIIEKQTSIPTVAIDTDGTEAYDCGIEKTYHALFHHLARIPGKNAVHPGTVGILGATVEDLGGDALERLETAVRPKNDIRHLRIYGLHHDITFYERASENEKNVVFAPSGLPAARWLQHVFGTPYEIAYPLARQTLEQTAVHLPHKAKNILIIHQQIAANAYRTLLQKQYPDAFITCATWFTQIGAIAKPQDIKLREESDLSRLVQEKQYDVILGDPLFKRTIPSYQGTWIPLPHPAVSGF